MRSNSLLRTITNLNLEPCIGASVLVAVLVFLLLSSTSVPLDTRFLATWCSGILLFLTLLLIIMSDATPEKTRSRAKSREANPHLVFTLVIFTAVASIFAIGFMLAHGKNNPENVALSIVAIICSWLLTHTTFALHYARYYYDDDGPEVDPERGYVGGLEFPNEQDPDYFDFMYFAFTISMTSQTSDVSIISPYLRRTVLAHEFVSFFFYSVIIGFVVNSVDALF